MEKELSLKQKRRKIFAILESPNFIFSNNALDLLRSVDPNWNKIVRAEEQKRREKRIQKLADYLEKKERIKSRRKALSEEVLRHKEEFESSLGGITISRLSTRIEDVDDVPVYKNVSCPKYELCLDFALKMEWPGFFCRKCKNFQVS
jgi:hypothetical protein